MPKINRKTASAITANSHSWVTLNTDPDHIVDNFLFGVLEREHEGRAKSAPVDFAGVAQW